MNSKIKFEKGKYGAKAIIKTEWQDSFLDLLVDKQIQELELNDGKGWKCNHVDFLKFLPDLKALTIIDLSLKSLTGVHFLNKLRNVEIITYCNTPINFDEFPELIECAIEWRKGSESLFKMSNIQRLFINRYKGKSSEVFSNLANLENLSILNSSIESIKGLSNLKRLKNLRLANLRKVTSLNGIENLPDLAELEIQNCKGISDLSEIFKLIKLRRLLLINLGEIKSIKGIESLSLLKEFLFYESTNIKDGDIFPAFKLKNLSNISFQNRRHYTHKREDFGELYS